MTLRPLVSVVTPTLNQGRFLPFTLRSVRDQTYAPVEHIVIDGGSTDGTLDVLEDWSRERPQDRLWVSGHDSGMYDAVNKGVALASGHIVGYLNSDDLYLPWTIEVVIDYFSKNAETCVAYGDYISMNDQTGQVTLLLQPPHSAGYIARSGFIPQPTAFWRRSLHEALGGFDASLQFVGDCDFWMRAADHCRVAKIDEVLAIDRIHRSAKRSQSEKALRDELEEVRRRYTPRPGLLRSLLDRAYAATWRRVQLARFVRASRGTHPGRWGSLLEQRISIRIPQLMLSLIPRFGARFLPSAVEIEWRTGKSHGRRWGRGAE